MFPTSVERVLPMFVRCVLRTRLEIQCINKLLLRFIENMEYFDVLLTLVSPYLVVIFQSVYLYNP